jgi:pimeloyl-ACP methyl ester carboxylesterase
MHKSAAGRLFIPIAGLLSTALFASSAGAAPDVQEEHFDSGKLALSRFTLQDGAGPPDRRTAGPPVRHALTLPDVDPGRVLIIGLSEGAAMAAGLAHAVPEVTHVALIGGPPGTTQLYDFAARIEAGEGSDADKLRRLQELDATVDAIHADPGSTDKFFSGHTYLRWSSFFAQSHGEDLARSKAKVYMVSGMQDASVPIVSTEVAYARLRGLGRDVTFRRLPGADHGLNTPGSGMADLQKEYDAIMAWFERH